MLVCARDAALTAPGPSSSRSTDTGSVATAEADVSEPGGRRASRRIRHRAGLADHVLVNNAGIYGPKGLTEEVVWDEWGTPSGEPLRLGPVQSRGAPALPGERVRQDHPALRRRRHVAASAPERARRVEGGGRPFAETLAEELRGHGIDVNAIAPGALNTRLLDEVLEAGLSASATRSTSARWSNSRRGGRRSTSRLALPCSSARPRATASPAADQRALDMREELAHHSEDLRGRRLHPASHRPGDRASWG